MRRALMIFTVIVSSGLLAAPAVMQDMPVGVSPYDVVDGWLKPFASSGHSFGGTSAVFAESPDRIFIAQRGEHRLPDPVLSRILGINRREGQHCFRESRLAECYLRC